MCSPSSGTSFFFFYYLDTHNKIQGTRFVPDQNIFWDKPKEDVYESERIVNIVQGNAISMTFSAPRTAPNAHLFDA